ncbi:MAG: pantoate--beta-alanine ligase, partial [Limisphaerales bacterium]
SIEVEGLEHRLDGGSRPGHFRGVATVVAKLLIASEADLAFFGQKDAAQVALLRRMVADLRLGAEIVVCTIVREADGLALSSRNLYLSDEERTQALALSRAVRTVEELVNAGERRAGVLIEAARQVFAAVPAIRVDFIELVDWATLLPVETSPGNASPASPACCAATPSPPSKTSPSGTSAISATAASNASSFPTPARCSTTCSACSRA